MNRASGEMRLAVIIPTLNEEAKIARTLDSLFAQKNHLDLVVVADGGSTDATLALAREHGATVVADGGLSLGNWTPWFDPEEL